MNIISFTIKLSLSERYRSKFYIFWSFFIQLLFSTLIRITDMR